MESLLRPVSGNTVRILVRIIMEKLIGQIEVYKWSTASGISAYCAEEAGCICSIATRDQHAVDAWAIACHAFVIRE